MANSVTGATKMGPREREGIGLGWTDLLLLRLVEGLAHLHWSIITGTVEGIVTTDDYIGI